MRPPGTLVLRLSVPANGDLRTIAADIAPRVAEYLGDTAVDAASVSSALEAAASHVAPKGSAADIEFEFRQGDDELFIGVRCGSRTSEVRRPLPA
jgi:hypothetical protein